MTTRRRLFGIVAILLLAGSALAACGPLTSAPEPTPTSQAPAVDEPAVESLDQTPSAAPGTIQNLPSGLQYIEFEKGQGPAPQVGQVVSVHYRGTLEDGTEFDNSFTRGQPIDFPLGVGFVIPGWDEGIALMNVGGKARLIIPPELAYGEQGAGGVIPPNATLTFDVELVEMLPGSPESPTSVDDAGYVTTPSGLKYHDFVVGDGPVVQAGQQVIVHYTGWLLDGTKFDSSLDRGQPFVFVLGAGQVIAGWDEGLSTMRIGGKRQLLIPPELAYGPQGAGGVIPPDATLIFEVELLGTE
jgi:peptidylprolyl isomerase